MGKNEVNDFFDKRVKGFMYTDIEREMAFAKSGRTVSYKSREYSRGGNFLCALGLLCYTEFDRQLALSSGIRDPNKQLSVYEVFRCGMAHEYFIKGIFAYPPKRVHSRAIKSRVSILVGTPIPVQLYQCQLVGTIW